MNDLEKILNNEEYSLNDITYLLSLKDQKDIDSLFKKAYEIKKNIVGIKVFFRGIIEFSNICSKDCFYCGIRKSNRSLKRYTISEEEIVKTAEWAYRSGYGSIILQSGEIESPAFTLFIENILKKIKNITNNELGITLSLGEQSYSTYKKWFDAGAHRYLLRIETSVKELYKTLHPKDHDFEKRLQCLLDLKDIGYQTGTGVMIGLPGQTIQHLASEVVFFKDHSIDMIGMGPYIPHKDTPMANSLGNFDYLKEDQLTLALKMISVTRLFLKDVNIAATTALQSLNDEGREFGLLAGANIIMPNITSTEYRQYYDLYDNKPCVHENSKMCRSCLSERIEKIGESIGFNEWGDSPHFFKRSVGKVS